MITNAWREYATYFRMYSIRFLLSGHLLLHLWMRVCTLKGIEKRLATRESVHASVTSGLRVKAQRLKCIAAELKTTRLLNAAQKKQNEDQALRLQIEKRRLRSINSQLRGENNVTTPKEATRSPDKTLRSEEERLKTLDSMLQEKTSTLTLREKKIDDNILRLRASEERLAHVESELQAKKHSLQDQQNELDVTITALKVQQSSLEADNRIRARLYVLEQEMMTFINAYKNSIMDQVFRPDSKHLAEFYRIVDGQQDVRSWMEDCWCRINNCGKHCRLPDVNMSQVCQLFAGYELPALDLHGLSKHKAMKVFKSNFDYNIMVSRETGHIYKWRVICGRGLHNNHGEAVVRKLVSEMLDEWQDEKPTFTYLIEPCNEGVVCVSLQGNISHPRYIKRKFQLHH